MVLHDVAQDEVLELVRAGEVDFGLGTASGSRHDLATRNLWSEVFVAVLPPGHALVRKKELTWRDLQDQPLIGPRPDNPIREQLDFALAREGISLTRLYEVHLPLTIVGMVEGGLGIGVMTTSMTRVVQALGLSVREIARPIVKREVSLVFHPDRSLSPAADKFRALLLKRRQELAAA